MVWVGILMLIGGAGMMMSKKKDSGIYIGGRSVQEEVGKQYGAGCLAMIIGAVILYFAS